MINIFVDPGKYKRLVDGKTLGVTVEAVGEKKIYATLSFNDCGEKEEDLIAMEQGSYDYKNMRRI